MIGTEAGIYALRCDLCHLTPPGVFPTQTAVEQHIKDNKWVQFTTDKGEEKHICPVCVDQIIKNKPIDDGGNDGESTDTGG